MNEEAAEEGDESVLDIVWSPIVTAAFPFFGMGLDQNVTADTDALYVLQSGEGRVRVLTNEGYLFGGHPNVYADTGVVGGVQRLILRDGAHRKCGVLYEAV
jgi:hypothetical protein